MLDFSCYFSFFFFNDTATTEIYTLSLHDALPICLAQWLSRLPRRQMRACPAEQRSEEHTSELQSRGHLVCRLLLEKKKKQTLNKNQKKKNKTTNKKKKNNKKK